MEKKRSYYKEGIRRMLLIYSIIPVAILTMFFLLLFTGVWNYSTKNTTIQENKKIETLLDVTVNSYMDLIYEFESYEWLFDTQIGTNQRVRIFEAIYNISNQLDKKADIYIFDYELNPTVTATKTLPEFLNGKYAGNWGIFRIMKENPEEIAIKLQSIPGKDNMQLLIGKALLDDHEIKGYAIFVMDSRQFMIDIAGLDSQTVITDGNGWVFLSNNYNFLDSLDRFDLTLEKSVSIVPKENDRYVVATTELLKNQIKIYSIFSVTSQLLVIRYIALILLFVFSMLIVLVLITSKSIVAKKTKDLYLIIDAFNKAKRGNLNTKIYLQSDDEFEIIAESYNQMLSSIKELIEKNREMDKLVASAQTKQLESQFNPHFLFNTLDNIRFMCKMEPDIASKMVLNLSTLLRYSISNTQEEVTVEEDIGYTENYMSILKLRFNHRFQYSIDIATDIESCVIPKLLIQPMIENSIKYGFIGREKLAVEIIGYQEDNQLIFICKDDGAGMPLETLHEMKEILMKTNNTSNHTGLYNINRRLQIKYGDEYGIQIESVLNEGTCLKVMLPIRYEGEMGGSHA